MEAKMEAKIEFDSTTSIEQKRKPTGDDTSPGGALFLEANERYHLPARYQIITADKLDELASNPTAVFGKTREVIEAQLRQQHPSPAAEASYLIPYRGETDEPSEEDRFHRRRRRWVSCKYFDGWFVMDRLYSESIDLDILLRLIQDHGPIYVPDTTVAEHGGTEELRNAGFVAVGRRYELFQLNFNPRRTRLDNYHTSAKNYAKRISGHFPPDAIKAINNLLRPQYCPDRNWPVEVPDRRGSVNSIREMREISRKLYGPQAWWLDKEQRYYIAGQRWSSDNKSFTFREAVEACLPFIHTEEKRHAEVESNYPEFCRWLRRMARALKLTVPPPPKPPKKPKPKRPKRAKGKRKRRAKRPTTTVTAEEEGR